MSGMVLEIASRLRRYFRPVEDARFLAFVRRFPCVGCGSSRRIEAAHIGPRGLKQRVSDCKALPLCFKCHQDGPGALHKIGPERFQLRHGIEFLPLICMFNRFYFEKTGAWAKGWDQERAEMERAA